MIVVRARDYLDRFPGPAQRPEDSADGLDQIRSSLPRNRDLCAKDRRLLDLRIDLFGLPDDSQDQRQVKIERVGILARTTVLDCFLRELEWES